MALGPEALDLKRFERFVMEEVRSGTPVIGLYPPKRGDA
jgi:hypothetical protein